MGTRSLVAIQKAQNIQSSYVHFDGYVTGVGGTILRHYNNTKGALHLAKLGYASSLCATIAETFEHTVEHNRDVQPETLKDRAALLAYADNCNAEYVYLYDNGAWLVAEIDGSGEEQFKSLLYAYAAIVAGEVLAV